MTTTGVNPQQMASLLRSLAFVSPACDTSPARLEFSHARTYSTPTYLIAGPLSDWFDMTLHRIRGPALVALGLCAVGAVTLFAITACDRKPATEGVPVNVPPPQKHDNEEPYDGPTWFEDVTAACGISLTYKNGEEAGHYAIIESLGGGIALFDFDGDGKLDVYITAGGYYEGKTVLGHPGKLFRNLGNWKFEDVTAKVGLDKAVQYSHGVAVADVNKDGWPDLLVTGYNRLALYMNESDGKGGRKFVNVTEKAGLTERLWSSGAAFADFDGDGFPDLYVCHYGDWGFDTNHPEDCRYDGKTRDVCPPKKFNPLPHKLYHNNGNGTFTDVSEQLNLRKDGKGLGVVIADYNLDGRPDIYVANDTDANFLYINLTEKGGPLKFKEIGGLAGVALDGRAIANGSMGLDVGDPNRTGKPAIFVTNYEGELHALYSNQSPPFDPKDPEAVLFDYESNRNGIGKIAPTPQMVGWGTAFCDLDRDGWEDLIVIHGHAIRFPSSGGRAQFPKLVMNTKGKFESKSAQGGSYFRTVHNGRGMALGDLDNDGKPDFLVNHLNEPVTVLKNTVPTNNHWVGLDCRGKGHRDVTGGRIVIEAGGETFTRFLKSGGNYASANDPRVVCGIAAAKKIDKITVTWPWGQSQEWKDLAADKYWTLTEGEAGAK